MGLRQTTNGDVSLIEISETPRMTAAEIECLSAFLGSHSCGLEFGCGGSTKFAAKVGVKEYYSVESDRAWLEACRLDIDVKPRVDDGSFHLVYRDLGTTGPWGAPGPEATAEQCIAYHSAIWIEVDSSKFDFVLVDGRFRVACTLQALAHCRTDTAIVVHDFWNRPQYESILDFGDVIARVEKLAVMRPRAAISPLLVSSLIGSILDPN